MPRARFDSYIICTSPRSGSTLLCKLLAATEAAGNPDSHFHTPAISRWLETYQLERCNFASDHAALRAIFEAAIDRGTAKTGIFGLRMQQESFRFFMRQASVLHPEAGNDLERIQAAFGQTLFIHLTRGDKLEQAISIVKAMQTGLWHKSADGSELQRLSAPKHPHYDAREIGRQIDELKAQDLAWLDWFKQQELHPLRISYEQLSGDPGATLGTVLSTLGLDPNLANGIEPSVSKLADSINRDWAERFRTEGSTHQ